MSEFYCILRHSHKLLFKAITTFWLPLLLNLFKQVLKVNYLAVWHFCSILCCSNLSDLQSYRKCYSLKIIGFIASFSPTCAPKGLPTLLKYKAIKWREQLVGSARKELTFKLIFESINLKLMERTRCVWWSWIKERWMWRHFF